MKTETYKDWQLFDDMPSGWSIDKTCGSPLAGYTFISNGKSILRGGKRALLRVTQPQQEIRLDAPVVNKSLTTGRQTETKQPPDPYPARTVNELARQRFKAQLLSDILIDLMICEIEGWEKMQYIKEIRKLVNEIGSQVTIDT